MQSVSWSVSVEISVTRFGKISPLWHNLRVYLVFGNFLILMLQINFTIGHVFIVVNGPILKNNLAILSHWPKYRLFTLSGFDASGRSLRTDEFWCWD